MPALLLSLILALEAAQSELKIVVVEGQGAVNNIRQRTAREPVVEVQDSNGRPVAGASVTFILPQNGPSGVFPNGTNVLTMVTDETGRAAGLGLRPNNVAGEFRMRVAATHQGRSASASIAQTNVGTPAAGISGKVITILGLAGAAATGGVLVARRVGSKPESARPVVVPGTPEVGRPR